MSLPQTYKAIYSSSVPGGNHQVKELPLPKPDKNQVLIKVEYVPINPTDFMSIKNNVYAPGSPPSQVGSEGAGIVIELGEELNIPFKVGDKVHVIRGTWGQYIVADTEDVFHVKGDLSLEEAASHFINPATVYYMGVLAQRDGHKAAIHTAGSSALGRMLIRYFKHLGIKLINIVRKQEYVEELLKEGADYVLNSTSPDFEQKLKEIAEKEKATIAFDAIAGDFPGLLLKTMPRGSTVQIYGLLSSSFDLKIGLMDLFQGKTLKTLSIYSYVEELHKKNEFRKVLEEVHTLLPTVFKSKVQKVFEFDDLDRAFEYYNENSSKGKILVKLN